MWFESAEQNFVNHIRVDKTFRVQKRPHKRNFAKNLCVPLRTGNNFWETTKRTKRTGVPYIHLRHLKPKIWYNFTDMPRKTAVI